MDLVVKRLQEGRHRLLAPRAGIRIHMHMQQHMDMERGAVAREAVWSEFIVRE